MAAERKLTANVPVWSVVCGLDWTLVAAASKRQAELLMIGRLAADRKWVGFGPQPRARRATEKDVERLRSFAQDEASGSILRWLGPIGFANEDGSEPTEPDLNEDQLSLL